MLTGRVPYQGSSGEIIMHKQLPALPEPLERNKLKGSDAVMLQPVIEKAMLLEAEQSSLRWLPKR